MAVLISRLRGRLGSDPCELGFLTRMIVDENKGESEDLPALENPFAHDAGDVCDVFHVDPNVGLTETQAQERLIRFGPNQLHRSEHTSLWGILVNQFRSIVVALLIAAALVSALMGEGIESLAIIVVILINTAIGFVTEVRASRSMEALLSLGTVRTRIRRWISQGGSRRPNRAR